MNSFALPKGVNMYIPIFNEVAYDNYVVLKNIVTDQWPLINDLYSSCLAPSSYLSLDSSSSLLSLFSYIQTINNTKEEQLFPVLASLHRKGVQAFFVPTQQENILQPGSIIYPLVYGASLAVDLTNNKTRQSYVTKVLSSLSPFVSNFTADRAQEVIKLETSLIMIDPQPDDYSDMFVNISWSDFLSLSSLDYSIYAKAVGYNLSADDTIIVVTPSFFTNLTRLYSDYPLQTITDYLMWRVLYSFQFKFPIIPQESLREEESEIKSKTKSGIRQNKKNFMNAEVLRPHLTSSASDFTTRELDCIDAVDDLLGDFLGLIFTMKVLDEEVINDIRTVTGGIQNSFKNNLATLSWIDSFSKASATYKLNNILQIIGHPNKLERYRGLNLDSNHFLQNIMDINEHCFDDDLATIGSVYDRSQNEFPATIVNAFYNPEGNTINFPAGILESPMFSSSFPKLMQYARMGYVIGHEITHGFDNHGRLWNAQGVYQPIMDEESDNQFTQRAQCIVDQYNNYQPVPGHFVDGEQTLGENIADFGGVKNAFLAYKAWVQANGTATFALDAASPIVPQLTNEQVFFVVMAQTWCTKANDAGLISQLSRDVHSPSQYRVNGPLSNLDYFSQAFSCSSSSPMNKQPKCELW